MRRGVYYPQLYIVKEDGDPPLRMWALSAMIQDRADSLPSYHQFITSLKDKVSSENRLQNDAHAVLKVNGNNY